MVLCLLVVGFVSSVSAGCRNIKDICYHCQVSGSNTCTFKRGACVQEQNEGTCFRRGNSIVTCQDEIDCTHAGCSSCGGLFGNGDSVTSTPSPDTDDQTTASVVPEDGTGSVVSTGAVPVDGTEAVPVDGTGEIEGTEEIPVNGTGNVTGVIDSGKAEQGDDEMPGWILPVVVVAIIAFFISLILCWYCCVVKKRDNAADEQDQKFTEVIAKKRENTRDIEMAFARSESKKSQKLDGVFGNGAARELFSPRGTKALRESSRPISIRK